MNIYRFSFVFLFLFFKSSIGWADCPSIGAIRWDAWYGTAYDGVGQAVERNLNDPSFSWRAPFCSSKTGDHVSINCTTSAAMSEEIKYATAGGIDYWAFVAYPENNPMSLALKNYLQNGTPSKPRFSLILTPNSLTKPDGSFSANIERFAGFMTRYDYQKVKNGRPLVFFLPEGGFISDEKNVSWLAATVKSIKSRATALGVNDPYLVLLDADPAKGSKVAKETGFDAISAYATHGNDKSAPYTTLASEAHQFWDRERSTGFRVVPTLMAGWDRRPRVINPMPWERSQVSRADEIDYFYQQPSATELADHVAEGIQWVRSNPSSADADTLLVYAWNESDEGGWLVPTLSQSDSRLKAIANKKRQICGTPPN